MSLVEGGPCTVRSHVGGREAGPGLAGGGVTVRSNASWVMVTWYHLPRGQTDTIEIITFPQLRWRAVTTVLEVACLIIVLKTTINYCWI